MSLDGRDGEGATGSRQGGISWRSGEVPLALASRTGHQLLASPVPLPGGEDSACQARQQAAAASLCSEQGAS